MEQKSLFARWRSNFLTGLVLVLPAVISLAVIKWLFGTISEHHGLAAVFFAEDHHA